MLKLHPNCASCDKDLPAGATDAMICSFETTYCRDCAQTLLHGRCAECGGPLEARPIRPAEQLEVNPASTIRVGVSDRVQRSQRREPTTWLGRFWSAIEYLSA